jgi:hypothetical protein
MSSKEKHSWRASAAHMTMLPTDSVEGGRPPLTEHGNILGYLYIPGGASELLQNRHAEGKGVKGECS